MPEDNKNNSRRGFLKNTALASLSIGMLPNIAKSEVTESSQNQDICMPTTLDYYGQGPFYSQNAPTIINNQLATESEVGTRIVISGSVRTLDCNSIIPNTVIDIWMQMQKVRMTIMDLT